MRIRADELTRCLAAIYEAKGVGPADARTVAEHQVAANLAGHDSHGAIMTPRYVAQIDKGEIVVDARLVVEQESETTAVLSGQWGFGFVMTEQALKLAMGKAAQHGVASVVVREQGHVGRLGAYAEQAANQGFIVLITADSGRGPKAVAPFGGRTPRLGTNPICFGVPSDLEGPVVLDMATSAVAAGKLGVARSRGSSVPVGWIVDKDGNPSQDPSDYFAGGAILPLGADQGHKGFGLSFMVEILCGLLTGLGYGVAADGRHNDGNFIALFDVAQFRDIDEFKHEVAEFVAYIKESPPAAGVSEIYYPGELEYRTALLRRREGIEIEPATWASLMRLMEQLGVAVPHGAGPS